MKERLKLNIQHFASTNKTTHYNLSQYIGTDKPTYLIDYNADMLAIDTAIYNAMSKATNNESAIGTLSSLTTDVKTDLVSAINEVDSNTNTNAGNISQNTIDIASNTSAIGALVNLDTTAKSNLVSAINEVLEITSNITKFNLTQFDTYSYTDFVKVNTSNGNLSITVGTNSDGSIAKIYGQGYINIDTVASDVTMAFNSNLRPTSDITINGSVIALGDANGGQTGYLVIRTTGVIEVHIYASVGNQNYNVVVPPCLYFIKDFGDVQQ